ncbi:MAG: hypothetical protein CL758_04755 [Chloroflexi bacterium]|nr:hypothetical protein [Chloroflexota bacterium]|tara:strand:- start:11376 stop:11894 length:519 start_codon:yes stop_codon:yes gene_type:complete
MKTFFDIEFIETKIGIIYIQYSYNGIKKIILPSESIDELDINRNLHIKNNSSNKIPIKPLCKDLIEYLEGSTKDFSMYPVDLSSVSDFAKITLNSTRKITYGQTKNYKWLAKTINSPLSYRAVGQVLSRNPCPIIIPCHRIISKNGNLSGFRGKEKNIKLKKYLLNLESTNL